jgi:hypothetical protein
MATTKASQTESKAASAAHEDGTTWADRAASVAGDLRTAAQGAVGTVAERGPEVVNVTGQTVERTLAGVQGSPTPALMLGTVFCAGLGLGLLIAGAPRPVVALALGPAVVMGGTLMARRQDLLTADDEG